MHITRAIARALNGEQSTSQRRRLAIVTTYDELCGIAGFSRCLVRAIEPHFALEVFDLDQFLLRQTDPVGRRKADKYFKSICRRLVEFDIVNLQLEYGTLGASPSDIFRRLRWLCKAAPQLSVTFHTVPRRESLDWRDVLECLRRLKFVEALSYLNSVAYSNSVASRTFRLLRRIERKKSVRLIVHTRNDRRYLEVVADFKRVYDHPLSFLGPAEVSRVLKDSKSRPLASVVAIPEGCKAIGAFGFLSPYKGFETAIRAMRYLPSDYHLLIFGGVHPNDIQARNMTPYVAELMKEVAADYTLLDRLYLKDVTVVDSRGTHDRASSPLSLNFASGADVNTLVHAQSDSLVKRVHFVGALTDNEFFTAMASCHAIVLPYQEVGQSSSGPASLAIELGCRTLVSRTRGFLQLGRYHPNRLEYFDVGNHLQLASLLRNAPSNTPYRKAQLGMETLRDMYVASHQKVLAPVKPLSAVATVMQ